jgi:hypothetical protein
MKVRVASGSCHRWASWRKSLELRGRQSLAVLQYAFEFKYCRMAGAVWLSRANDQS